MCKRDPVQWGSLSSTGHQYYIIVLSPHCWVVWWKPFEFQWDLSTFGGTRDVNHVPMAGHTLSNFPLISLLENIFKIFYMQAIWGRARRGNGRSVSRISPSAGTKSKSCRRKKSSTWENQTWRRFQWTASWNWYRNTSKRSCWISCESFLNQQSNQPWTSSFIIKTLICEW